LYIFPVELLRDAESIVHETLPELFQEAGLGDYAAGLRSAPAMISFEAAISVCELLQGIRVNAGEARPAEWCEIVEELAFWGEGAVWAAADGEIDLFNDCLMMVKRVAATSWAKFGIH